MKKVDKTKFMSTWPQIYWAIACGDLLLIESSINDVGGVEGLRSPYNLDGISTLWVAAWFDQPAAVDLLLASGITLDPRALAVAVLRSADVLSKLREAGATIYDKDSQNNKPFLSTAAKRGNLAIARLLLSWHPDMVYMQGGLGQTALHAAASSGHLEICRLLLEYDPDGGKVSQCDGWKAIHFAAKAGHRAVVELLLERCPGCVLSKTNFGHLALHVAAEADHEPIVGLLLSHDVAGASLTVRDRSGFTPLHHAVKTRNQRIVALLLSRNPETVNIYNNHLELPIDLAALDGNESMIYLLIRSGADMKIPNKAGITAAKFLHDYKIKYGLSTAGTQTKSDHKASCNTESQMTRTLPKD